MTMQSPFGHVVFSAGLVLLLAAPTRTQTTDSGSAQAYENADTRELVGLVVDAAGLVRARGEAAFSDFRAAGSRWRQAETYIFVLDLDGGMLVHPDPALEGRNQIDLRDINGKPIIRGLIDAVTTHPGKSDGWYHYEWPVPGGLFPRWKSSYVRLAGAPSGKRYVIGSGMYNDRMERAFVVDMVQDAVARIEKNGAAAYPLLRDMKGAFVAKDAYVFVIDRNGVDLVNPAFPNLEGRNLLDVKDTLGKPLIREMLEVSRSKGSGWVDYMWPKPGESASTQKSTYVGTARVGGESLLVGCGIYLAGAPTTPAPPTLTAPELTTLVRDAAAVLAKKGERAYPQFRVKGSKWFQGDTYLFVWALDGTRVFHAAAPEGEGRNVSGLLDVRGRPIGKMILEAGDNPSGEGWIHYMYPEPGGLFPIWKSTFVKRVTFPSGQQFVLGSGIYNMRMDKAFVEDVVDRAAALIAERGPEAFSVLRDKTGPFVFMDTYVFVQSPDGTELVNAAMPSLEGKNLWDLKDLQGKFVIRDQNTTVIEQGRVWIESSWFKPGDNTPARKLSYVRKVLFGDRVYIVGSGIYLGF